MDMGRFTEKGNDTNLGVARQQMLQGCQRFVGQLVGNQQS